MIEIFDNIPERTKKQAEFIFDMAMRHSNLPTVVKILDNYTNTCINEEEKEFLNFYFNMRMEQMLNGNNFDKR